MDMETVCSLFVLFAGEEDTETYMPLITAAAQEVVQELIDPSESDDARLCYLAAAVANLRYTQLFGAREKALATYAGNFRRVSDAQQQMRFAKQMVYSYRKLCAELLRDPDFVFFGVRG